MPDIELYGALLGLTVPWTVAGAGREIGPSGKAQVKLSFRPTMGGYPSPIDGANLTYHLTGDTHAHSSAPFL
jgi:hypothetical protein